MNTGKRLFQYALLFKRHILIALLLLTFSVSTELAGPFIAKKMIDKHMLGIEKPWFETTTQDNAVSYHGAWYMRQDRLAAAEAHGREARVLQVGRQYYWVGEALKFDGARQVNGNTLTINNGSEQAVYRVNQLTSQELYNFYRPELRPLLFLALMYFFLLLIGAGFSYGQRYLLQTTANRIIQRMRVDVFAQIQRLPVAYFDNLPAGKVVSRITNDTETIRELYVNVMANFFTGAIYIVGILIALSVLNVKLALICLPIIPLLYVWIRGYRYFASKYNHAIRSKLSDMNGIINESIQGMPIIQAFRRQKETMSEFEELNHHYFTNQNKMLSLNSLTSHNLVNVLRNVMFVWLIWMLGGGSLGVGSALSIGMLYAFVDYLNRLFQPITGIVNQLANMEQALVSAERVFELLKEDGIDVAAGQMGRYRGNVKFEHVNFRYNLEQAVLKNITFDAVQGETVALVGHTGSGKSSIMNVLFRFYDYSEGKITIDGIDIRDIPKQLLRKHMGIVLQDPFLFTGTIASNVSLDDPSISRERVEKALRDVGAADMFGSLPNGIDEPVIEKGSTLSAGQRQLISFARALAFDPAILILDEATASIDTETESIIQAALDVLKRGRTTFIIAHRLSTIKNADQILVLDHGEIVERGSHDDLMKHHGKYYQMYQLQQGLREPSIA